MPIEIGAKYISQLVETNPDGDDTRREGDDHIRLVKGVLRKTFPNFDAPFSGTPADLNDMVLNHRQVKAKMIVMYWGDIEAIPEGWVICDGTNGTPDLRERFILAAGEDNPPGTRGGTNNIVVDIDTEQTVLTVEQLPSHGHNVNVAHKDNVVPNSGGQRVGAQKNAEWAIDIESTTTGGGQGHSHNINIEVEQGNMPLYLSLLFIMKLT